MNQIDTVVSTAIILLVIFALAAAMVNSWRGVSPALLPEDEYDDEIDTFIQEGGDFIDTEGRRYRLTFNEEGGA